MKLGKKVSVSIVYAVALVASTAAPAFAAPLEADDFGLGGIFDSLVSLLTGIAKPIAVLGLVGWGVAQFIQPFAPEVNSKFQGYSTKLVLGAVLVIGASQIANWLFSIGA
jgi:hypothetical protein